MAVYPDSWWRASAPRGGNFAPLSSDLDVDVAIIGAGFTGLSAAHHAQARGMSCAVLEANCVGWGASGRNGGIIVPRYKWTFPELERHYSEAVALLMHSAAHDGVSTIEEIVHEHGLECGFARCGHLTPIVHAADIGRFSADVTWLAAKAGDRVPLMLNADETAMRTGSALYGGAYFEPRGASVHPLAYCLSLGAALAAKGVQIHCETPVLSWDVLPDAVMVKTPAAKVRAKQLIIGTNAYSDLTPANFALRKRIVPAISAVISTQPLPEAVRGSILPGGEMATDAKRLTNYYRVLPDGSFFFGGRGGASNTVSPRAFDRLREDMVTLFPQLDEVPVKHRWSGLVAMTLDTLPHLGSLHRRVHFGMGYNGRGVGLATLFGKQLVRMASGEAVQLGPMTEGWFKAIPFHSLRLPAKQAVITWKQLMDSLQGARQTR